MNVDISVDKLWIKKFDDVFQDILAHNHTHYDYLIAIVVP